MASVGKHIRALRTARHMTQAELANKLFVTRQAVSAWETGKALPDVETLERISAILEVDVTEVIYGAHSSPDLKRIKRHWALIGGISTTIVAVIFIILTKNGTWGTWRTGLQYQLGNSNYRASYEEVPGTHMVELNLTDLESNRGKILYEDDSGCRIVVHAVDFNGESAEDGYRVWFQSYGSYGRRGGQLVSGSIPYQNGSFSWVDTGYPLASVSIGGLARDCPLAGTSGLNRKNGNQFGFHLPIGSRTDGRWISHDALQSEGGILYIEVTNLTRLTTTRMWYWEQY